jgi:ABC-type dipeptide/oligopeptide/nickel transport system permease component
MLKFILKRFAYGFLVISGVLIVVFFLFHALPGDPIAMMAGQRTDEATKQAIAREFGLDQSLPQQLVHYVKDLSPIATYEDTSENQAKYCRIETKYFLGSYFN